MQIIHSSLNDDTCQTEDSVRANALEPNSSEDSRACVSCRVVIIAAVAKNRAIGKDNQLLWNIPEDMAHFRTLTKGKTVVMGRKTWESLPEKFRPLPGRRNVVITRQSDYSAPGADLADSLESAFEICKNDSEVFVIGGAQIYEQAMQYADHLEITEVNIEPDADAFFPKIGNEWEIRSCEEHNGFSFLSMEKEKSGKNLSQMIESLIQSTPEETQAWKERALNLMDKGIEELKIQNTYNPFSAEISPKFAEIIAGLMPKGPELSEEEKIAQAEQRKKENKEWEQKRFGKLPQGTYRILDQGSLLGWYFEIEIDGVSHIIEEDGYSEFLVHNHSKDVDRIARQIIAKHHGEEAATNAKFVVMFGGQM